MRDEMLQRLKERRQQKTSRETQNAVIRQSNLIFNYGILMCLMSVLSFLFLSRNVFVHSMTFAISITVFFCSSFVSSLSVEASMSVVVEWVLKSSVWLGLTRTRRWLQWSPRKYDFEYRLLSIFCCWFVRNYFSSICIMRWENVARVAADRTMREVNRTQCGARLCETICRWQIGATLNRLSVWLKA